MSLTNFFKKHEKRIALLANGCWHWNGAKSTSGYGNVRIDKVQLRAHRVSYEDKYGKISKDLVVDHLCRNKLCVNPLHLEAVTQQENVIRGNVAIKKTHCNKGHKMSAGNLYHWMSKRGYQVRACKKCTLERSGKRYEESREVID